MKKLLITTMAAVSVGLCAKAEDTGVISETSFEGLTTGGDFEIDNDYWQTQGDTEDQFKIIDVEYSETATQQHWNLATEEKALSIDTSSPLVRNVDKKNDKNENPAQNVSTTPIFFDSVVQFTATDVAPSMENNTTDKLAVWLYSSPEDVSAENPGGLGEKTAVTNLVITAGEWVSEDSTTALKTKHYLTNIPIEPDSWHRLTIKSFVKDDFDKFNVWVDGTLVVVEEVDAFDSLIDAEYTENGTKLQGVAFDGKGAVDDIVFTTTAPEFAKEPEGPTVDTYAITTAGENAEFTVLDSEGEELDAGKLDVEITTVGIAVKPAPGYVLQSAIFNGDAIEDLPDFTPATKDYYFEINVPNTDGVVTKGSEFAFSVVMVANSGVVTVGSTTVQFDDNGKITNITTANNGQVVTGEITDDMFADYYAVSVVDGKLVIALDPEVAEPTIDETAVDKGDAIVVTETEVALGVTNAKAGLWYGAQAYSDAACTTKIGDEPIGWEKATGETVTVTVTKPEGDKAFFKVVVDDQDHTPAEEPK